jgi:hypothetical protein
MDRDTAHVIAQESDRFVQTAAIALIDAVLDRLDSDDPDVVERIVAPIIDRLRADLTDAVTAGVAGW